MSRFIEIVASNIASVHGLAESKVAFGGEFTPYDPPKYIFDNLEFEAVPIAKHVLSAIPATLQCNERCLEMSESVVLAWSGRRLNDDERACLRRFFDALVQQPSWAVVFENDSGEGCRTIVCPPEDLFQCIDDSISGHREAALMVFSNISASECTEESGG
jgi:hypothetical protein